LIAVGWTKFSHFDFGEELLAKPFPEGFAEAADHRLEISVAP
tara:strand:+ start:610 stop:735 length:126 start_codon:yes stop_codon:yes gene_type:complete